MIVFFAIWCLSRSVIDVTNVVKIRYGKETHVFRFEQLKDKKSWLASFRQAFEELAARRRKEREGEHERRRSVWTDGNVCLFLIHFDEQLRNILIINRTDI